MFSGFTPSDRGGTGTPIVCLHGFMDTWRTWELVLPLLRRRHDVLALTLAGHAGGPPLDGTASVGALADAAEQAMDAAGIGSAHLVGNSLGGYLALVLAARGRARSVVALAPAGGWAPDDPSYRELLQAQLELHEQTKLAAPQAHALLSTIAGRRRVTQPLTTNFEHIPIELLAHQMLGSASCRAAEALIQSALSEPWDLSAEAITCRTRIIWGTADRLLPLPGAAVRYRAELPHADWLLLEGAGHCPQLDVPIEVGELILEFTAD